MSDKRREIFAPKRNEQCFCDSGERFKHCCGATDPDRRTPHGIVIVKNFLSPQQCQKILAVANAQSSERLKLFDIENSTADKVVRRFDDSRITRRVDMSEHQELLNGLFVRCITNLVEPDLGVHFDWFEEPQVLKYEAEGFYAPHADSENLIDGAYWSRALDRDMSILIYLDEDYEGGELLFPNFGFKIKPRPGMLVYFPSDSRYMHTAQTVTFGTRHAIVSWLSQTGVEKLRSPPEGAVLLHAV